MRKVQVRNFLHGTKNIKCAKISCMVLKEYSQLDNVRSRTFRISNCCIPLPEVVTSGFDSGGAGMPMNRKDKT